MLLGVVVALVVLVVRLLGGPAPAADPVLPPPAVTCVPDATTTQNCWPAITEGTDPRLEVSPWVTGRLLAGDVRTVLDHVAARFDAEVEPVDVDSSWGWAYRSVRGEGGSDGADGADGTDGTDGEGADGSAEVAGGAELSNHASGTSIDLNATEHPLGATGTFTDDQVAAVRAILAEVAPVVAWGGDFGGRADEMHFEIVGDAEAVAEVARRLRGEPAAG
ncbi:hypothetical protein CHMI_00600 [Cellulomonas hominis]|nr:hypothetical protein CHMI_00600 [Cellulomonas hominis]